MKIRGIICVGVFRPGKGKGGDIDAPRPFPGVPATYSLPAWGESGPAGLPAGLYAVAFAATGSGRLAIIMATKETAARTPAT